MQILTAAWELLTSPIVAFGLLVRTALAAFKR